MVFLDLKNKVLFNKITGRGVKITCMEEMFVPMEWK
jgi:hypothetical protein